MTTPIILRRAEMLKKWGLKSMPPFNDVPPKNDPKQLARLFTGRTKEIERALLTLLDGNNLLVRGVWGIGKTTFILNTLHELNNQTNLLKEKTLTVYIDNFKGGLASDFYRLVLFSLALSLRENDKDADAIANKLQGINISHTKSKGIKGQAELNLLSVGKIGTEINFEGGNNKEITVENPEYWVEELITRASKKFDHIVIAIDDLDKADPNLGQFVRVREMFDGTLPLLRNNKCAFVLAGRTLTVAQDIYGRVLGIFREQIQLPKFEVNELREVAIKTLNLVRNKPSNTTFPFSDEAIDLIILKSGGNPRQFNRNCLDILSTSIRLGIDKIDKDTFSTIFNEVQANIGADIDGHVRHLLYIAQKYGGFSQDNRNALKEVNSDDFIEILPQLEELVEKDLMYREDNENGPKFLISPRAQLAASKNK